ncbi:hypothetical protein OPW21_18625 [Vibrio europaeus]|uniref:hypothetical protein n=1 Tax=Vibrio europaeus TaxID=300876 RepID=UPI001E315409|nr:hypothetical protein [Vibrio europaeus]MDC5831585.1 hypothetical protein [Vibrio europaeus]
MINKSISYFLKGILFTFMACLLWGIVSALLTEDRYSLKTSHPEISNETLTITLKHGQAKAHFVSRAVKTTRIISYDMHGLFLRFGDHYLLVTTDDSDDVHTHGFAVRKLFIKKVSDNQAFLITDRRGSFTLKDGRVVHLNSIFSGNYQ